MGLLLADQTFVISLRNSKRREGFKAAADEIGLENWNFYDGFDGYELELLSFSGRSNRSTSRSVPMSPGEIGCFLSHQALMRFAHSMNLPSICIIEDDVRFKENFVNNFEEFRSNVPWQWELMHLSISGMHFEKPKPINDSVQQLQYTSGLQFCIYRRSAINYYYRRFNIDSLERPIDDYWRQLHYKLQVFSPVKELITHDEQESTL